MDTDTRLIKKLNTALITTRRTMALGSGNKITDYEKSNGWSAAVHKQLRDNKDALYQCYPLTVQEDPLKNLPSLIRNLIKEYHVVLKRERVGNCGELARFISLYLWQHAGQEIHNIEVVTAGDFDHTWVILNRKESSDLSKPEEWGNAWIVDPWWGDDGLFYPSNKFHEKIIALLAYIQEQNDGFYQKGNIRLQTLENFKATYARYLKAFDAGSLQVPLTCKNSIHPKDFPYPIDEKKLRALEDYYDYSPYKYGAYDCRTRAMSEKAEHQQNFTPCLNEIKGIKMAVRR